ncbi:hypothetical protein FSP39_006878 [Pinctada imbricata]|uniref:Uncharacterized protein n=1 Tax=Pinctada imbricata TaxID=66713 RepID=A0AA88XVR0_PINIB|nr:hypothetical protein FSP39_006878 [Pinctada imbricata]
MIVMSIYLKIALGLLIAAFVCQLIGFAAPYWNSYSYSSLGLWQACNQVQCYEYHASAKISAVRAFEVIGFIILAVVLLLLLIYICKDANPILILISLILCFVAAGCILLGVIIWAAGGYGSGLSWAFVLCIIAGILALIAGILLIPERRSRVIIVRGGGGGTVQTRTTTTTVTVSRR